MKKVDVKGVARLGFILVWLALSVPSLAQSRTNYTSQGRYELSRGRHLSAIELLNKSISLNQFNSEAFFLRGIAKFELEDFLGADKDFSTSIELNPKNHEAFLNRGVCRSQLLQYKEAFMDYGKSVQLNDEDWRTYSNRALASLQLDRYVDVISDCNKVIDLKKANSYTYLVRGEAKAGLEMYKVAIEDFERAINLDSLAMRPVLHRGIAHSKLDEFELAIVDFNTAIKLDDASALPIFHRGVALAQMGKTAESLVDFAQVLVQHPDNGVVLFNRALVYSEMNKISLALEDYNRVVQLNPKNILGYFNRGILQHNKKAYKAALADYNQAIELFPEFLEAHENKLEVLKVLNDEAGYNSTMRNLADIRSRISLSDDDVKMDQHIKLMKVTELKGEFEPVPQEVGKIQHQKVDIRLLPFYGISAFPETDSNILVYDGFNRPYYNTGAIAFTTAAEEDTENEKVEGELKKLKAKGSGDVLRMAALYARIGQYSQAQQVLSKVLEGTSNLAATYFARASVYQMEQAQVRLDYEKLVGSLDVIDSAYQAKTQRLLVAAEMDYRKVLELDKDLSFAHFNLGHLLANAERYEEAETQFGLAAEARGNFIEANFNRGLIRILLGKTSKGCEDLSLAGELGLTNAYNVIKRFCE